MSAISTAVNIISGFAGAATIFAAPLTLIFAASQGAKKAGRELRNYNGAAGMLGGIFSIPAGIIAVLVGQWQNNVLMGFIVFIVGILITAMFLYLTMSRVKQDE